MKELFNFFPDHLRAQLCAPTKFDLLWQIPTHSLWLPLNGNILYLPVRMKGNSVYGFALQSSQIYFIFRSNQENLRNIVSFWISPGIYHVLSCWGKSNGFTHSLHTCPYPPVYYRHVTRVSEQSTYMRKSYLKKTAVLTKSEGRFVVYLHRCLLPAKTYGKWRSLATRNNSKKSAWAVCNANQDFQD